MAPEARDVVVVGGGAIGLSIGWRIAAAGLTVTIVDAAAGSGSSAAAAGMLAPASEAHFGETTLLALNLASAESYPAFVEELEDTTGLSAGYRRCGTLVVARHSDDGAQLIRLHDFQKAHGLDVKRLRSRECRELEPALAPSIRGGLLASGDHAVDNRMLVVALLEACTRSGARLHDGRVTEVRSGDGGRVTSVDLADGESMPCGAVVVAAGCWSGSIEGVPPESVPVRPVKGQLLYLRGPAELPLASRNIRSLDVYVVGRGDGRVAIGATVEEMGFDTTVTAGAAHALLRDTIEILPGAAELELVETVAGLRPGSPDNAPIIGATEIEGLTVATGHYRNGILLTPVTADAVAELVVNGKTSDLIAPFGPARFAAGPGT